MPRFDDRKPCVRHQSQGPTRYQCIPKLRDGGDLTDKSTRFHDVRVRRWIPKFSILRVNASLTYVCMKADAICGSSEVYEKALMSDRLPRVDILYWTVGQL